MRGKWSLLLVIASMISGRQVGAAEPQGWQGTPGMAIVDPSPRSRFMLGFSLGAGAVTPTHGHVDATFLLGLQIGGMITPKICLLLDVETFFFPTEVVDWDVRKEVVEFAGTGGAGLQFFFARVPLWVKVAAGVGYVAGSDGIIRPTLGFGSIAAVGLELDRNSPFAASLELNISPILFTGSAMPRGSDAIVITSLGFGFHWF